jgi:hypothetical protein
MLSTWRHAVVALSLCAGLHSCGGVVPPAMNEEELVANLLPRGDERLVVANFWASW